MRVSVKLYATLQEYSPPETELGKEFSVDLTGRTVIELLSKLGIKDEQAKIVMVNGIRIDTLSYELKENDLIVIFPPIGGG
ncbi:MAG: MoaD/ThiS family protein [Promethearchaeota archaeon]